MTTDALHIVDDEHGVNVLYDDDECSRQSTSGQTDGGYICNALIFMSIRYDCVPRGVYVLNETVRRQKMFVLSDDYHGAYVK